MSELIKKMIAQISEGKDLEAGETANHIIAQKMAAKLDSLKEQVAKEQFNSVVEG